MAGFGDIKGIFEAAQKMQGEMARIKEELAARTVTGESGGGLVRCVVNGKGEVVSLELDPIVTFQDEASRKMAIDLIVGAVNVGLDKSRVMAEKEVAQVTAGLNLAPGLFGGGS